MELLYPILAIIAGFVTLVWGADRFVLGSASIARNLGVSPLVIGLTIVGFGTSAPEMLVSAVAAASGNPALGVGNAIGSNITNVALVLGVSALVSPLAVHSKLIRREIPLLILVKGVALLLVLDRELGVTDGVILLTGLFGLIGWVVREGLAEANSGDALGEEMGDELPEEMSTANAAFWFGLGLLVLLGSSRLLVWGAVELATMAGVSELVIGLTIVAFGTSLPELAASVMAALKDEHDIAVGNIVGSNLFNLLGVLALPGVIAPGRVEEEVVVRDFPIMIGITVLLLIFARGFSGKGKLVRLEGGLLLACFVGYIVLLYLQSTGVVPQLRS